MAGGRPSEFNKIWNNEDGLLRIAGWARDGLSNEQIAKNMGINVSTLYDWQKKYGEFAEALKKSKEIADRQVENALFKSCLDRVITVKKCFKVKHVKYDNGKRVAEDEEVVMAEEEVPIPANTTAQIFWLSNRMPGSYKRNPVDNNSSALEKLDEILSKVTQGLTK